jgi:HAD superfamily hydrolase (TIGR01549 family)
MINCSSKAVRMQVEAVLFDLFDTLVIIEDGEAFYMPSLKKLHRFLINKNIDIPFDDFCQAYFEVRDRLYVETSKSLEEPHFSVRVSQTLQKLGYSVDVSDSLVMGATEAFSHEFMKYMRVDDDAIYVLKKLHRRYKLGIVSNASIPEVVWKLLPKSGLDRYFEAVVISGAINKRKPSLEIFEKALKILGVSANRALFVGDTLSIDIKGAKSVGLKSILIRRQHTASDGSASLMYKPSADDEKVAPNRVIKTLRELLHLLKDC